MNLLDKIGREFSGYNLLESGKRLFDKKPLQCSLYLTDRCNLDCSYCTEYDNSKAHPKLEDLKLWIKKIRDLGTMRIALVGGEPLTHPDVVEIVRYCRELGFATSLTTNGFLLTRKLLKDLEDAGLQVMQISVDRMTPSPITKKSFKTILPKLDYFKDSKVRLHITGVICADTLPESKAVLETGLARGIPTEVRLVHADPLSRFRVERGNKEELAAFIDSMIERKRAGEKIHTNEAILQYQKGLLLGEPLDWTCTAGYKLFFVSAQGIFWECSMVHGQKHIMDITPDDLHANHRKKSCQAGCGVYCAVSTSLLVQNPVSVISKEIVNRAKRIPAMIKEAVAPPAPAAPPPPTQPAAPAAV
ncbi:MAG TPA: radical SAM protein [Chthoniobacterales bacterium]|jgi:MoaA/NifB/PqqE/SkfB family radical SAM enzyme|nr:radical SAM protein [Chthoniobacterales bacterium]